MRNVACGFVGWGEMPSCFAPVGDSCFGEEAVWESGELDSLSLLDGLGGSSGMAEVDWVTSVGGYMTPLGLEEPPWSW